MAHVLCMVGQWWLKGVLRFDFRSPTASAKWHRGQQPQLAHPGTRTAFGKRRLRSRHRSAAPLTALAGERRPCRRSLRDWTVPRIRICRGRPNPVAFPTLRNSSSSASSPRIQSRKPEHSVWQCACRSRRWPGGLSPRVPQQGRSPSHAEAFEGSAVGIATTSTLGCSSLAGMVG